jgi:hypothetical protein
MQKMIQWLKRHRTINILLVIAYFLAVVGFHDEVTMLAIQLRRKVSIEGYNLFFSLATLLGFTVWFYWIIRKIIRFKNYRPALVFLLPTLLLTAIFFFYGLTYTIEAVHYFQYAILAILLFPLLKSYGATVFWTTLLGVLDETYQYVILTPSFRYFDLNDILLNLLGAGLAVVTIYLSTGIGTPSLSRKIHLRLTIIFILSLAVFYAIAWYTDLIHWYPASSGEAARWFTINRTPPGITFWTETYKGKYFHIVRPWEGIGLMIIMFAAYFRLDHKT